MLDNKIDILESDGICLSFGETKRVLSQVYIPIYQGKVTGLLGRNGSGKSCLMEVIFGSLNAESASIRINGQYVPTPFLQKGLIRYLPQSQFIPKELRISKIFDLFELEKEAIFCAFPELEKYYYERLSSLSGGLIRLLEVLMILKSKVRFVLLDEPFSHIMPLHIEQLQKLIEVEKQQKGILISDHLYKSIVEISDDLYLLTDGTTFRVTEVAQLYERGYLQ